MGKDLALQNDHVGSNPKTDPAGHNSRTANPTLGTIRMVEETLSKMPEYPSRNKLWRALPRQIQYSALKEILKYMEESNKIVFDKNDKIVWIFAENPKLQQLKESSKSVFA
ncbi:MAG: hypothetical protein ACREBA_02985 [Nitrosotalea sp.]